jgi:hypothetical protein
MTAPVFVNAGAVASRSFANNITPALPGSRVNGNLLIVFVNASTIGEARTFNFPGGWTVIGTPIANANGNSALAFRYVDGSETAPAITMSGVSFGGADDVNAVVYQYTGVVATNPIGNTHSTGPPGSSNATISESGIVLQRNNSLVLGLVTGGGSSGATVVTPPSGYTAESNINTGGMLLLYDDSSASAAGASSPAFSITLSRSTRYMAWSIELASEALVTEVDITAAPALGISQATTVDTARSVIAAPDLGVSEAATLTTFQSLTASMGLGIDEAASFDEALHVAASISLGIGEAAAVVAELRLTAAPSLGASMAAALIVERHLTAAPDLGVTVSVRLGDQASRQPVVNCTT